MTLMRYQLHLTLCLKPSPEDRLAKSDTHQREHQISSISHLPARPLAGWVNLDSLLSLSEPPRETNVHGVILLVWGSWTAELQSIPDTINDNPLPAADLPFCAEAACNPHPTAPLRYL